MFQAKEIFPKLHVHSDNARETERHVGVRQTLQRLAASASLLWTNKVCVLLSCPFNCHRVVRIGVQCPVSARLERNRKSARGISVKGSFESIQASLAASWTGSGLTGSPRAHVVSRIISAAVGFGPREKENGLPPARRCCTSFLHGHTSDVGTRKYGSHFHLPSRCRASPPVSDNAGDAATVTQRVPGKPRWSLLHWRRSRSCSHYCTTIDASSSCFCEYIGRDRVSTAHAP